MLRLKGGSYYGRFSAGGKTKFVRIETDLLEIARTLFTDHRAEVEKTRKAARSNNVGTATMADLLDLYHARVGTRSDITEANRIRTLNNVG